MTPSGPAAGLEELTSDAERGTSLWKGAWRRLRRNPSAIIGAVIMLAFVLVAVFAPLLTGFRPGTGEFFREVTPAKVPGPSEQHWLGLDAGGSDMWTQLVYGARQSLIFGIASTVVGLAAGASLGVLAGGFGAVGGRVGSWIDNAIMRLVDILLSIPSLLLAVSIAAIITKDTFAIIIAIAAAQVPIFARLLRSSMLTQGRSDYVLAASALGFRKRRVVMSHILPNSVGPTIVQATLNLATAIIEVAALSYLGLGEDNPRVAEWGRMLVAAQERFDADPRLAIFPGICIVVTALGFTLFGEALREALDPRSRR
ncbi:MAG: binding-protein-dependent transport system inner rane component [Nocardioides sp.]|jgi:peptide/nickel transport system permease protein|nr:binding-protein-dependent transport system inner rane component [Nocardioides sp.]